MSAPWTEAHRREALLGMLRIMGEVATSGPVHATGQIQINASDIASESSFRDYFVRNSTVAGERIDREVRRVRGLAEGRLVRETEERYRITFTDGHDIQVRRDLWEKITARDMRRRSGRQIADSVRVRVTRIRSAS